MCLEQCVRLVSSGVGGIDPLEAVRIVARLAKTEHVGTFLIFPLNGQQALDIAVAFSRAEDIGIAFKLDGVVGKLGEKRQAEQPKEKDPALTMDMQNTVSQALASRTAPPQAGAPQAGAPKTNNGFGRTNLA